MKNNTLILGVGNILRRDDGIGPVVLSFLKKKPQANIDYLDGGIDGLTLLEIIKPYKKAIIIDAVDMGMVPGTVKIFTSQNAKIKIKSDALSTHGFGLAEVIGLAESLEIKTEIIIVGVQPKDISFGENLTPEVANSINVAIKEIEKIPVDEQS